MKKRKINGFTQEEYAKLCLKIQSEHRELALSVYAASLKTKEENPLMNIIAAMAIGYGIAIQELKKGIKN